MARIFRVGFPFCVVSMLLALAGGASAQQADDALLKHFVWRSVGPAGAGGRIVDIAAGGDAPRRIYVAAATGGLWKSTNEGTSWEAVFDHETAQSIGDVTVDPTNADVVWVGSGEVNPRNSVSWGDGVYKSTNGGKSWTNVGLKDTRHIGRIVIDPRNPNVVYVGALGHLWGPNKERGVFKTTDGGQTWTSSLFIDADTGVSDLVIDPFDGNTIYAAAYEVRRDGFAGGDPEKGWGPGSGIYKTTDAGRTWRKLTAGLPSGDLGRIGIGVAASNPSVLYAVVQTPTTVPRESADEAAAPPAPPGPKTMKDGGVFRSDDRGETWHWMNATNNRPFYYSQVRIDPSNENHLFVMGSTDAESEDGGRTFRNQTWNIHVDHHAMWIDPRNPKHILDGNDGGIDVTWDGGRSWEFLNELALSQMYSVDVDMRTPYFIYGGAQDYCSWGGPSATRKTIGIQVSDWFKVQTGDGFQVRVDPSDYTIVYAESQNGGVVRHDLKSGRNTSIKPRARSGQPAYRFNWETPLLISAHDPKTIYIGGNYLFKSTNRGDAWTAISPELTTDKEGTLSTFAESPLDAAVLYAGTDDGNVWATRDGGRNWKNITSKFPGMPGRRWVSRVVASRYQPGTVYLAFDGHRSDDVTTYLFKSTDYGDTWKPLKGDLPANMPVRVVREDVKNPHLLFAGTEAAAYASFDDGAHWIRLMNNLPTVPVADLIVHPRDGDLIAATHGRSFYVMDISPLQELTPQVLSSGAHLFTVKPAIAYDYRVFSDDQFLAQKRFIAENPPPGVAISYFVKAAPGAATLTIVDKSGAVVRELEATKEAGINRVQWDLRGKAPIATPRPGGRGGGGGFGGNAQGALVDPGEYVARLVVDGQALTTPVVVQADPLATVTTEDRSRRREIITSALALQAKTEPASVKAESAGDQLEALRKAVDEYAPAPAPVKAAAKSAAEEAAKVKTELARVNRSATQLFGQISGSPFLPTETQVQELDDLTKEFAGQSAALNTLLTSTVPALDKQLNDAGVPRIIVK